MVHGIQHGTERGADTSEFDFTVRAGNVFFFLVVAEISSPMLPSEYFVWSKIGALQSFSAGCLVKVLFLLFVYRNK